MQTTTRPRIAIVYEPESVPLLKLAELAASNVFDPVWVTDDVDVPILRRLGTVVQGGATSAETTADRLTQLGVVGVTTFADPQIARTAAIGRHMGLPAHSAATARCLMDKIAQRQALADAGVPGPAFVGIHSLDDLTGQSEALSSLRYPVVVKPAFGFGGRDTLYLKDPTAVRRHLRARGSSRPFEATIVEECLGVCPPSARDGFGDYVSVEVVAANGVPTVVAVTGRMPLADPFRETGAFLPSTLSPAEHSDVADMATRAAHALGVGHGCLHIEIKLTEHGPRIIEVNGRVPGGGIVDLVAAFNGVDLIECALRSAVGHDVRRPPSHRGSGVHYQLALQPPIGRRVHLRPDWSPQLRNIDGLDQVTLRSTEAEVGPCDGSYGYLLMASGMAVDHCALSDTYRELYDLMVAD